MMARSATQRLMGEVDNLVTQCANEMWSHWSNTNMSFQQRIKVPSIRYFRVSKRRLNEYLTIMEKASTMALSCLKALRQRHY